MPDQTETAPVRTPADQDSRKASESGEKRSHTGPWHEGLTVAERYVIERRLGGGAMGEVFLAKDHLLKKQVALKALRPHLAENRTTVRRFLREVALAHSVTHPNVVRIYDTGEADGVPYFSMEFLKGQRLDELIEEGSERETGAPLSLREIREISHDILDAVDAAHAVGVVHRDLKPSNVMLTHRGAIVMDFGVAGIEAVPEPPGDGPSADEIKSIVVTEAGTIFGSPAYMAPELWEGAPAVVQTDLYAFGVMLYEMLTGRLPIQAASPAAFLEKLRHEQPTPVRVLRRDTPWNMALLVKRCMEHYPDLRPVSATAAANVISPLRSRTRRRAVAVAAAGLGLAAGIGILQARQSWTAYGLPDAVAEADLTAAVRSYDVGDRGSALRQLARLETRAPDSAAVGFWQATVHYDLGDEVGRRKHCSDRIWLGSEAWQALARAACGPGYVLSPSGLETFDAPFGGGRVETLPIAVSTALIPRIEAAGEPDAQLHEEANAMLTRLGESPSWTTQWAVPTRWEVARVHLEVALGRVREAHELASMLAEDHRESPLAHETAAWLDLWTGNLERARDHADALRPDNPGPSIRLMLEEGRLEDAWKNIEALGAHDARTPALQSMWCGYAYRFEVDALPEQCTGVRPGVVRMLWGASPDPDRDWALATPLEQTILKRQREINLGECSRLPFLPSLVTHASPPFETYLTQLDISAAICAHRPSESDLKHARHQAQTLTSITPQDPWAILMEAQVDEAVGVPHLARAKRLAVADRWRAADSRLPLVARLRRTLAKPAPAEQRRDDPTLSHAPSEQGN